MIIDTHCHLYLKEFADDIYGVMDRAKKEGVSKFYLPAIESSHVENMIALENKFPAKCFAMIGLHPCSVKQNVKEELKSVQDWLSTRKFAAVGEIGLDFYWDKTFLQQQFDAFHGQAELAIAHHLPIVIHSRDSTEEAIEVVRQHQDGSLKGIFHCFGGSLETALKIIDLGFYLGIGGVVTYKNSGLAAVLEKIPLEHIVLETDAPYLTPVPFRGKRNESSYLKYIVARLAELKKVSVEEISAITTSNAEKIFGS